MPPNDQDQTRQLGTHMQTVAFLMKSLSDENRLRILMSLADGKKSVSRIVEEQSLSQPLVSHHLKELKRSLLVTVERQGPFIYYEMADPRIVEIVKAAAELATHLLAKRTTF
ncbi:MAG: metalloregulator ArsR/SmtB family transcription factor [Desulfomonilaceae bacterium]|nr:metalloregulator ArsR/SmtB family transcription factor [Desulfomonilaceae bacterium]